MQCLILRLDAPLMSFGGVAVDQINPIDRFPGRSMLVGLLGNAMGWDHADAVALERLQARLQHAARWDAEPERVVDYQTVDLGQPHLRDTGWTTRGRREERGSGAATTGTHQRYRHYWANGVATVALTLMGEDKPGLDDLEAAVRAPARPLFLGRKTCLPSLPVFVGRRDAPNLRTALQQEPLADIGPRARPAVIDACWPLDEGEGAGEVERHDRRDWINNVHRGGHPYAVGVLEIAR